MGVAQRDPVSQTMDRGARALLSRVYAADTGGWVSTRLKDPTLAEMAWWAAQGISVRGPDPVPRGGLNARTRWARAFVRALWYQHKWYSGDPDTGGWRSGPRTAMRTPGIEVKVGRHLQALGVIPAGHLIQVRLGSVAAAQRGGQDPRRWAWAGGGPRWADPAGRDWAALG